ncbi:hypothetical protein G195_003713 [Phytophthora kernoviae 00238/432]|uniref:Transmembrane protein n=2 Tax=Phytophthora kernoviae TaxID=325452 RepID=A0A8T0M690_9STRA|nr:hypothetical protein G195_003713 [Phytophthora kernoviae 00238/432]KAG2529678.1 hypothetical protein JM16_001871 [Phytophthora kernoviae]
MLNTNPSFDYGAFRALAAKVNANSSTVSAFAFSFTEAGTYVFGNSLNDAAQTIVVVMKAGTTCPTEAPIVPLNEKNLITVSAKRRTDDLILAPDWALIIGLLSGLLGVVVAVIAGLYYFRTKSWTNTAVKSISGYRAKSKQVNLAAMHSKGTVAVTNEADVDGGASSSLLSTGQTTAGMKQLQLGGEGPHKGDKMEYKADLGRWDEEDLDLRELVDRLQFHHEAVTKNFEDQKGDVKQLMQHLQAEAIEVKRLFVGALVSSNLSMTSEAKREESSSAPQDIEDEMTGLLPMSTLSGRPRTRSIASKEKFLLENLERDLQERNQFEQKKSAMIDGVSAGLHEVEEWGAQFADLASALVQEMSLPVKDGAPERTTTSEEATSLERTRMVLGDLKTMLGSDPMSQTSSSLIHLTEAEKGRREVGNFVLEASQRYFVPHSTPTSSRVEDLTGTENVIQRLLGLHNDVEKAQNKEDEASLGPLLSLQKFGAVLPQVLATLDDLETNFRHELDAVREQQNPVKLRAVQAQMQSRLSKLLKEVAAGAKKVNEKLEKEAPRALKVHRGALQAEGDLTLALAAAKDQSRQADLDQRDRVAATNLRAMEDASLATLLPLPSPVETDDSVKSSDDTLFQIKELLVELATMMRTRGASSILLPEQQTTAAVGNTPVALVDTRVLHAAGVKRNIESSAKHNADAYASALDAKYPQLSAVEKERLLDDFASDLRKIQSSVSVDATRTQADIATRQTATEVLRDTHKAQVQHREQEDAGVLRAQHEEEEQSLESQFRQEELAIEQEYLKELSSLEMEFGDTSVENDGDFAEPHEDTFEGFNDEAAGDGSSSLEMEDHEQQVAPVYLPQEAAIGDDNADIIAQLNNVYSQAWNDRVHLLDMEERLRKEQLSGRLRRKRNAQQDNSAGRTEEMYIAPLIEKEMQQVILDSANYREAALEEVVKKQDDMDALQQETVERAVARLKEQITDRQGRIAYANSADRHDLIAAIGEMAFAARNSALKEKENGEDIIAMADNELQQLYSEYGRDFSALREEINNERLRLEAKLHENLLAKQRRRATAHAGEKNVTDDKELNSEIEDDDGNSPEEKLEDELAAFAKQAVEQLKGKHLHLQRKVEERKALATVAVAVSNAQIQYLDGLNNDGDSFFISTKTEPSIETANEQLDITGELLGALANQIPAQIEQQTQQELDKLRAEYMAACNKRRVELEADAAARRSRLAEKMSRRRLEKQNENPTQEATTRVVGCTIEAIDEQEHVALAEINEELKTALEELDESERHTVKVIGQALSSSLHKSGKEVEGFLRQCQQKHELALSKLEPGDKSKGQVQTVLNALNALEVEMSEREQVAAQARGAIEREIDRLNEESSIASVALSQSLEAEKRHQEQRLHQRMAQRRELQRSQLPPGSSPEEVAEMNDIISKQETVEKQRLEDQLDTQAQLAFVEERAKQRENEDRLSQQLRDASVVEATVSATKEALAQVRDEYASGEVSSDEELAPQLRLWETRIPRNVSMISATDMSARKRSMIARLAAQVVSAVLPANSSITGVENIVGETMAAEMERQIRALSANHHFAWQQRRQELQEDEARRKTELERRLLYKREAKHRVGDNAETAGQPHEEKYESEVELHQQLEAAVIERKFAMEAELESELEQLAAAIQSAGTQSTADIEALLAACHSNFVTETAALCNALQVQRQTQQEALRQRLLRKRQEKLQELGSSGNATDPIALAALERALKQEEATVLHTFAEEETCQLSVLHDRLRNEVGKAFAEADCKAKTRCDEASSRLADRESELSNIYRDHEESKRALHEALEVERRRQQNKLLERTARRRAERLAELKRENPNGLSEEVEHRALGLLESDYEHERLRLDAVLNEQENLAQREHDDKIRAKEGALQLETQRLRGEAEAAQAAREALIAAHCAEADRVTREFYACLEGTVDIKALKARDHRRRLEERLAAKCTPKGCSDLSPKTDESYTATSAKDVAPPKETIPAGFKDAVVDELERELQNLHAQHDRDWESLKTRLKEETRLRKAQLQDRLKRKRQVLQNITTMSPTERANAEAVLDREEERENLAIDIAAQEAALTVLDAARLQAEREVEKALQLEEQEELAAIERSRTAKLAELETESAQEQEHLSRALREADKRGAADIEQQLAACKLAHEAELAKLDEALRAERARQELALKQRLAAKRYRHKTAAADTKDGESHEVDESYDVIQKEMERQEHEAREQLVGRQQQELADVVRKLEDETEAQRKAATDLQVAAERELRRLEEEHVRERRTLQDALLTDQRQREAQLREKLAKKKAARQTKGTQVQQDSDSDVEADVAMAALQEQFKLEQAVATTQERQKQETALRQAEVKLQVAAKSAAEAAAAARQAQEESARVTADFDRHRGETQQLQATQSAHSKRKLADRLAEKKQKQKLKKQQSEKVSGESIAEQNITTSELEEAERLRLEAQIEAQLAACREAHDAESTKLHESLRIERERQEHALQERIARRKEKRSKAEAHAMTKGDVKTAEEAELKQEEEDEEVALATALATQEKQAWEAIQRKQDEDLRALQEIKQQQERERAEHQKQLAEQEMNRLQQEHERELRTLEASLSLEQARQEEKLQQRIAQRRAKKQRQEEEAVANSAKLQQATADAEEESRDAAAREKTKALAEAQAQAEAEAEEIERQEIAIRLAHKLEEERARQQRETQELTARLVREAEVQAAKHAEALALQLQQEAAETADKLAREFDINLRELRDSHSADGAAQKARLESRIAVKKARKLRELEEKRELERQRLHARQQQEADEAANAEKEREAALEEAVIQAAIPIIEQEDVISLPAIPAVLSPAEETTNDLMRAALQQQHDVTAVQQLFTYGLVPQKLSLLGAVELVVGGRHERELMALLTGLATRSSENVRRTLEIVMQQKATRKAQALQEIMTRCSSTNETKDNPKVKEETERELDQLDREFTDKLREAEQIAIVENEEAQAQTEKHLKERQMREMTYLLAHFDAQHTAALANVVPLQQPQQFQSVLSAPQREADDLEVELRARLELEADDRRRTLGEEKRQELERLSREEQTQIAKVEDHLAASLAEEQAALTKLLSTRVKALPDRKSKQREALEREHAAQLQRLTLMLEGRGTQHKMRVRARMAQQKLLIEDEFRRKAQVIIAVMNQRLVQEKAELRQKQNLLAPVIATPTVNDPQDHRQETGSAQLMLAADLAKRLENVLEERLAKIEALVTAYNSPEQTTSTQDKIDAHQNNPDEKNNASAIAYRWAVAEAVAVGCRYEKPLIMDAETSLASSLFGLQLLQEKLDTAEKLYLKVLRQYEQQTQTLEYWQDLLAELRGTEYDEDAFDEEEEEVDGGKPREEDASAIERQRERDARAQEAQTELDRATYSLEVTRVERDELFGQCQQLRDQLTLLRGGHKQ